MSDSRAFWEAVGVLVALGAGEALSFLIEEMELVAGDIRPEAVDWTCPGGWLMVVDGDGIITRMNQRMAAGLGCTTCEVEGQHVCTLDDRGDCRWRMAFEAAIGLQRAVHFEMHGLGGRWQIVALPLFDAARRVWQVVMNAASGQERAFNFQAEFQEARVIG